MYVKKKIDKFHKKNQKGNQGAWTCDVTVALSFLCGYPSLCYPRDYKYQNCYPKSIHNPDAGNKWDSQFTKTKIKVLTPC